MHRFQLQANQPVLLMHAMHHRPTDLHHQVGHVCPFLLGLFLFGLFVLPTQAGKLHLAYAIICADLTFTCNLTHVIRADMTLLLLWPAHCALPMNPLAS
jgi:hypothetical protein